MQPVKPASIAFVTAMMMSLHSPAQAALPSIETWIASNGSDTGGCASPTAPCQSLSYALTQTTAGGQINIINTADYGSVVIEKSVTIVNDRSATASIDGTANSVGGAPFAQITVAAGANDVVTIRGLVLNNSVQTGGISAGLIILNANRVNIQNCLIQNDFVSAIDIIPEAVNGQSLTTTMNVVIQDSVLSGSNAGMRISSVGTLPVNVSIVRTQIVNNLGGGVRIEGANGGVVSVSIADSAISHNGGSGVNAISSANNVVVNLLRDVVGFNGAAGVQANGGAAAVLVNATSLMNNAAAISAVGGGRVLSYGNNSIVGSPGTGFTGPAPLQ